MRTPKYRIRSALRKLWLHSKERNAAIQRDKYTCQQCGVKKSTAKGKEQKVEVHHKLGILNWDYMIELIYQNLLVDPEQLETLCPDCHGKER